MKIKYNTVEGSIIVPAASVQIVNEKNKTEERQKVSQSKGKMCKTYDVIDACVPLVEHGARRQPMQHPSYMCHSRVSTR